MLTSLEQQWGMRGHRAPFRRTWQRERATSAYKAALPCCCRPSALHRGHRRRRLVGCESTVCSSQITFLVLDRDRLLSSGRGSPLLRSAAPPRLLPERKPQTHLCCLNIHHLPMLPKT